ncbi:MAG: hypothetical protein QG608_1434 [Actinomycetota bacterium]|nr:hypothetical protein [Actinomycetota bacterium]
MAGKRRFGGLRRLPSGRWQATVRLPDGTRQAAPETFPTKRDAQQWLSVKEAELLSGGASDPLKQRQTLAEFGNRWIEERPGLRPRTLDLYRWLFRRYILPSLGAVALGDIDPALVRRWRAGLLDSGTSPLMAAKAYRLLRAVLMTAVEDGVLLRNPCRIRGAGTEKSPERPVLTVQQVFELAERVPARFRLLVLVTTFGSLRWGEVTALRRCDFDSDTGTVHVRGAFVQSSGGGGPVRSAPKSRAGLRSIILPQPVAQMLAGHLSCMSDQDPEALIFTGSGGSPLLRGSFNRAARWSECVRAIGVPGLHFHDLRHTGNHLAAQSGASLRDLMLRMGHDSMRAALIYQHANQNAGRHIAVCLDGLILRQSGTGNGSDGLREQDERQDPSSAGQPVPTG